MGPIIKIIYVLFTALIISIQLNAQVGQEFWFVAPDAVHAHGDEPLLFRITTFDEPATVTITMPANGSFSKIVRNIGKNTFETIEVHRKDVENRPVNSVNNKGILIESSASITAYYEIANEGNPDKFTLKGDNGLGLEFYVPSQNVFGNMSKYDGDANEKVDIVATEDNTIITITPTVNVTGHNKGEPYDVKLNKGQTYCIEYRNIGKSASLAGTYITSNKPIAITISDDSINETSHPHDIIGDQLIPTSVIGSEYIAVRTSDNQYSVQKVFVLAIEDDTYVYINNDKSLVRHLNKGELTSYDITDNSIYIKADYPVYAYQVSGLANINATNHANELGSALLPTIECTGSSKVAFTRVFVRSFWVQILTQARNRSSFQMYDSKKNTVDFIKNLSWRKVKGTGSKSDPDTWYSAIVNMNVSTGTPYTIENTKGLFHLSILDENDPNSSIGSVSYGYFSSYGRMHIEGPMEECVGEEIVLSTSIEMENYKWFSDQTGDEVLSNEREYHSQLSGKYWVTADVLNGGCTITDSIEIVFNQPDLDLGNDTMVCQGSELDYVVKSGYDKYQWSNGDDDYETDIETSKIGNISLAVTITDEFGCTNHDEVEIEVVGFPEINLNTTEVCYGGSIENTTDVAHYEWIFKGEVLNTNASQNWITPKESGIYTLTGWNEEGCSVTRDINVTVNPLPQLVLDDVSGCEGEIATINGPSGFLNYEWSTGETSESIQLTESANYWLEVTDVNGCKVRSDASLVFYKPATLDLGSDLEECIGVDLRINGDESFDNYSWTFVPVSGTPSTINPPAQYLYEIENASLANSGIYKVEAKDANGCAVSDEVIVTMYDAAVPELSITENLCDGEVVDIIATDGYDSYTWYQDGFHIGASDNLNQLADVSAAGIYRVEATIGACEKSSEIKVVSHGMPDVSLPSDFSICEGGSKQLKIESFTSNSGASLDYLFWNDNENERMSNWQTASLEVSGAGKYGVTVVDEYGCRSSDHIVVTSFVPEVFDLGLPQSFCANENIELKNPVLGTQKTDWYQVIASSENYIDNASSIQVNSPGRYLLKIVDAHGCEASDYVDVIENPVPEVSISGESIACGETTLFAQSSNTNLIYQWNNYIGLNSNQLNVGATGNYNVRVWDENGCSATADIDVTIHELPSFELQSYSVCEGETITVEGPVGYSSYKWSTGAASQNIVLSQTVNYSLTITDANSCKATAEGTFEVKEPVGINLGDDLEDCEGSSLVLSGDDYHSNWQWTFTPYSGNTSTLSALTDNEFTIVSGTVADNGVYSVQALDENGCLVKDEVSVNFYSAEPPALNTTKALCEGDKIEILASEGYDSYKWFFNGIEQTSLENQACYSDVSVAGLYKVEAVKGACVISNEIEVVEHSLPNVKLPEALFVCNGIDTELRVQQFMCEDGGLDYLYWNEDPAKRYSNWQTAGLRIKEPGRYTVTAIDEFGCIAKDFVDVSAIPEPNLLEDNISVCENDVLTLSIDAGYASYEWSNGDEDHETQVNTAGVGEFKFGVSVTDDRGCVASDEISVLVEDVPTVLLDRTEVCLGEVIRNVTDFVKYEWEFNGDVLNTVEKQNWIEPQVSGVYAVTGWTADGCIVSEDINITVHQLPGIHLENQIACKGTAVEIHGPTGFSTYKWSTGASTQNIQLNSEMNYWLQVTDANGCQGQSDASLRYIEPLGLDLGPDKNDCVGVTLNITGDPSYTNYNWSFEPSSHPGAFVSINPEEDYYYELPNVGVSNSGVYHVEAKDINGCYVSDEVSVNLYSVVPPSLRITENLCAGEVTEVLATQGYDSYTWFKDGVRISSADDQYQLSNVNEAGIYRVETSLMACVNSQEIEVVEKALPTVTLSGDYTKLCEGAQGTITIENYSSPEGSILDYLYWNSEDSLRYANWNIASLHIENAGLYKVTVVDENGCVNSDDLVVESAVAQPLALDEKIQICYNDKVLLENPIENYKNYNWFKLDGTSRNLLATNENLEVDESGVYLLQVVDDNGCEVQDEVNVNVIPLPTVSVWGDRNACDSTELVIIDKKPDFIYKWNDDDSFIADTFKIYESDVYNLDVWDEFGCYSQTNIDVQINKFPEFQITNDTVCAGENGILTGPVISGLEYNWSTGEKTSSVFVPKGNYSLKIVDANGCSEKLQGSVIWRNVPKIDLGPDTVICPVDSWILNAGSGYSSYLWHNGYTGQEVKASLLDTVNKVVVTDIYGCSGFDSQTLKFQTAPEMELCSDTAICNNDSFALDAGYGFLSYLWDDGWEEQIKEVDSAGEYWVEVTDGCFVFRDSAEVVFLETPVVAVLDTSLVAQVRVLGAGGTEPYEYSLDGNTPNDENVFRNLKNGVHELIVTDANGCEAIANFELNNNLEIDIPEFFTPNGDGTNDTWEIIGIEKFPDSYIRIFDRYGKLLIKYKASEPGWDGTYLGRNMPTDDYWYVIDGLPFHRSIKGHITLKRK